MSVPDKDWSIVKPKPLTKERIILACLEETIKQLPLIQHRLKQLSTKFNRLYPTISPESIEYHHKNFSEEQTILSMEYAEAMEAKREMAERVNQQWADYIHNQATLEFYSQLK